MTSSERDLISKAIFTFIWSFKKGDNILYNMEILWTLYDAKNDSPPLRKMHFNKPIMLVIVAIIECFLDDFVDRIQEHVSDKLPNVTKTEVAEFRKKKLEKFEHYIATARKYNFFEQPKNFYTALEFLRDVRNRLHIQNTKNKLDKDEHKIFNDLNLHVAEKVFDVIFKTMMEKFPRGVSQTTFDVTPAPWRR